MIDRSALERFVAAIKPFGLNHGHITGGETTTKVELTAAMRGDELKGLDEVQRMALLSVWPDATTAKVFLGSLTEPEHVFDAAGPRLPATIDDTAQYTVRIEVNKAEIADAALRDHDQPLWYMTTDALVEVLDTPLATVQQALWPDPDRRATIAVSDTDCDLRGPLLRVVGGDVLSAPLPAVPAHDLDKTPEQLDVVRRQAELHISHDHAWGRALTPYHPLITDIASMDEDAQRIVGRLNATCVASFCLFTCDRARRDADGNIRAEYRSSRHIAHVTTPESGQNGAEPVGLESLTRLADWIFDSEHPESNRDWTAERLQLAQLKLAEHLHLAGTHDRIRALVEGAPELLSNVDWAWGRFMADTLDGYEQKVQELEAEVGSAISSFSERTASVTKQVTDAMLAAVAAVIGSFIGATFSDKFNEQIFVLGMYIYAGYVVLFPGLISTSSQIAQFRQAQRHYEARRKRFSDVLTASRVQTIEGSRVASAKRTFWITIIVALLAYGGVAIGAHIAAQDIPDAVAGDEQAEDDKDV